MATMNDLGILVGSDIKILNDKINDNKIPNKTVGNIDSPLLDMPLIHSLDPEKGSGNVSFSRASTATYIDRYGVLKYAEIDEPRFEKDGLLIEGNSTNKLLYSKDFDNSAWTKQFVTINSGFESPDGLSDAFSFTPNPIDGDAKIFQSLSLTQDKAYTSSIWLKGTAGNENCRFFIVENDGRVSSYDFNITSEWARYTFTVTILTSGQTSIRYDLPNDNIGSTVYAYGAQLEELPFASSYIPTTDTAVTRSSDLTTLDYENNCVAGDIGSTTVFDFDLLGYQVAPRYSTIVCNAGSPYNYTVSENGSLLAREGTISSPSATVSANTNYRVVTTNDLTTQNLYINGEYKSSSSGSPVSALTTVLVIGDQGAGAQRELFGHIKNFKTYDFALTDTEASLA